MAIDLDLVTNEIQITTALGWMSHPDARRHGTGRSMAIREYQLIRELDVFNSYCDVE